MIIQESTTGREYTWESHLVEVYSALGRRASNTVVQFATRLEDAQRWCVEDEHNGIILDIALRANLYMESSHTETSYWMWLNELEYYRACCIEGGEDDAVVGRIIEQIGFRPQHVWIDGRRVTAIEEANQYTAAMPLQLESYAIYHPARKDVT